MMGAMSVQAVAGVSTLISSLIQKIAEDVTTPQIYVRIDEANIHLVAIMGFLKEIDSRRNEGHGLPPSVREIRDLAYFTEDAIDTFSATISRNQEKNLHARVLSMLVRAKARSRFAYQMKHISRDIKNHIPQNIEEISGNLRTFGQSAGYDDERSLLQGQPADLDANREAFLGFQDHEKNIVNQLTRSGDQSRCFVSIAGSAGVGKASLAKLVYHNSVVKDHFDFKFWFSASEGVGLYDILGGLLDKMDLRINVRANNSEYLVSKANEYLQGKRYLVVLDNFYWDEHSFEMFRAIFPDYVNGSRVLMTTCFLRIPGVVTYELHTLPQNESCELLLRRAFRREDFRVTDCPNDLDDISKQFVKKCDGLPLALVVVGDLLSTLSPTYDSWCELLRSFQWQTHGKRCMDVMATSYKRLPSFLQPCFLYLASFPEGYEISATSIIKIWIAEGFIQEERRGMPEDIAESYIEHLILRSMVRVTKRSSDGAIKYFCVHPVLREMAKQEADEISFLTINPRENTDGDINRPRRVAFHGELDDISTDQFPHLRAILAFQDYNLTSMRVKYLRVMELCGSRNLRYLPKGLKYMILLRYLGLRNTGIVKLPKSIGKLLNLQTLDARNTEIKHIPKSLWNINALRHVQVLPHKVQGPPPSAHLENLQTIGIITTPKAWEKGSPCLPNLRKLKIDHPENLNWNIIAGLLRKLNLLISLRISSNSNIPNDIVRISSNSNIPNDIVHTTPYECHPCIQRLHLIGVWISSSNQQPIQLPPNLTKLVLDSSKIKEDLMPTLEKLKSLRILRLVRDAITVEGIVCSTRGFPKLQQLELNNLTNLKKWTVEEHAMPMLNYLCVKECPRIEMPQRLQLATRNIKIEWDAAADFRA